MSHKRTIVLIALALPLFATTADAQSLQGAFRGALVCELFKTNAAILRAPLDLLIRDGDVIFARPIFGLNGPIVVGNELGTGTIGSDGKLHLTATWENGGNGFTGDYSGTLTATGGTFSGTENWHESNGATETRPCNGALVPVREGKLPAAPK